MALITRKNIFYRFQQLFILVAHLALLKWMLWALRETGSMNVTNVMIHFTGMAIYGGLLIFGTATWAKRHYMKAHNLEKLPR